MEFNLHLVLKFDQPFVREDINDYHAIALQHTVENILREHLKEARVIFAKCDKINRTQI